MPIVCEVAITKREKREKSDVPSDHPLYITPVLMSMFFLFSVKICAGLLSTTLQVGKYPSERISWFHRKKASILGIRDVIKD